MDSLGNVNHTISVVGYWIFDSNYEKALFLNRASLEIICASSVGEGQGAKCKLVFTSVRYICSAAQLERGSFDVSVETQSYPKVFLHKQLRVLMLICLQIPIRNKPIYDEK